MNGMNGMNGLWTILDLGVVYFLDERECAVLASSNRHLQAVVREHVPMPHQLPANILESMIQGYRAKRRGEKRKRCGQQLVIAQSVGVDGPAAYMRVSAKLPGSTTSFKGRLVAARTRRCTRDESVRSLLVLYDDSDKAIEWSAELVRCSQVFEKLENMIEGLLVKARNRNVNNMDNYYRWAR